MTKAKFAAVFAAGVVALFTLTGCEDKNMVDEKDTKTVPGTTVTCYFLEVEIQDTSGEETGEYAYCADKAEWDQNRVGKEWVGANGKKK